MADQFHDEDEPLAGNEQEPEPQEEVEQEDDMDPGDGPRLLERIANNDPTVTSVHLTSVCQSLGLPNEYTDVNGNILPTWWWFEVSPTAFTFPQDRDKIHVVEQHIEEAISSFQANTTITTASIDAYFGYEMRSTDSTEPGKRLELLGKRLFTSIISIPSLEWLEIDDEHELRLEDFIETLERDESKVKVLKIKRVNMVTAEECSRLANAFRKNAILEEILLDMNHEEYAMIEHMQEDYYVNDLFDAFATMPNLKKLHLEGQRLRPSASLVKTIRLLLGPARLTHLSLKAVEPDEWLCINLADILCRQNTVTNLQCLDLRCGYAPRSYRWKLTRESIEAFLRVVDHLPSLSVLLSYRDFGSGKERRSGLWSRRIGRKDIDLSKKEDVNWYLEIQEVLRDARLDRAGLGKAQVDGDGNHTRWTDVLSKVNTDTLDLLKVIRKNPSICNHDKTMAAATVQALSQLKKKRKLDVAE